MNKEYIIYKITNLINGKVYIGQTCCVSHKRWVHHIWSANRKTTSYLHRAMKKYGVENFTFIPIISALEESFLDSLEILLISQYQSFGQKGYNLTIGGGGKRGFKVSAEVKRKIGKANLGRKLPPISEETRHKISLAAKGRQHSDQTKNKISVANKGNQVWAGRKHTVDSKRKMYGKHSGLLNGQSRGRIFSPFGIFSTIKELAQIIKRSSKAVRERCNNTKPKWSQWYYEDQMCGGSK